MLHTYLEWGEILPIFFPLFFFDKNTIGHISGMVGPIDVKQKGSTSV